MTAYSYRMRRSFLLVLLMLATALLLPTGHHHHADGHVAVAVCAEQDTVPVHEHRDDAGPLSPAASRGRLTEPRTTVAGASTPAPPVPSSSRTTHVDLRLPGILRV